MSRLDTTYTIRRLGCSSWREGVRYDRVAAELYWANDRIAGHVAIAESGEHEGETVDPADIETEARREGLTIESVER